MAREDTITKDQIKHKKEYGVYHIVDSDGQYVSFFLDFEANTLDKLIERTMTPGEYKGKEGWMCIVNSNGEIVMSYTDSYKVPENKTKT